MTVWHITKGDSADLGFAVAALIARAVSLNEFKQCADRVIVDLPADALPPWIYDLSTLEDNGRVVPAIYENIGFAPYDPVLEAQGPAAALDGIAFLRGQSARVGYDLHIKPEAARTALDRHKEIAARFHAVFPFIELPGA